MRIRSPDGGSGNSGRSALEDGHLRIAEIQLLVYFRMRSRQLAPIMITLAVIGIIYGALVAMVQPT